MANNKDFIVKSDIEATNIIEGLGTVSSGSVGYDLASASYDSTSFDDSGHSPGNYTFDFSFADSGTKLYMQRSFDGGQIFQYTVSTAFDLSTASYASKTFTFAQGGESGFVITPDGNSLYISANTGDKVMKYAFSTPFDVTTLGTGSQMFSTSSVDTQPDKCKFNSDGTKFFLLGRQNLRIYEYSVSSAYDLSTASYSNNSLLVSGQAAAPLGFNFNNDGTKLFVSDNTTDKIFLYNLTTGYDITTASYASVSFSINSQDAAPSGIDFNSTGTKMYVLGVTNTVIYQYSTVLNTSTLDLSTGSVFNFTPTSNTQVTLTNPAPSGTVSQATLVYNSEDTAGVSGNFSTTLYTGNGGTLDVTTGIDLSGSNEGLVWLKKRSGSANHALYDTVRGATYGFEGSNSNASSAQESAGLTAFSSTGFSLGNRAVTNDNNATYAAWGWKSATNFFDIVSYSGNATSNRAISHNLGSTPGMIICKSLSAGNWGVWHRSLTGNNGLKLNGTDAAGGPLVHDNETVNSTSFGVSTGGYTLDNQNGNDYVAYLFAHNSSSISCGSYTGNGSGTGPEVNLGFVPQWIMIKRAVGGTGGWFIFDTPRGIVSGGNDNTLQWEASSAEGTGDNRIKLTTTGFQIETTSSFFNNSGDTYIYMAIAEESATTTTYNNTIDWPGGTAPTSPAIGETDVLTFSTSDGGATYKAVHAIDGAK